MTRDQIIKEFTDNIEDFQDLAFNIAGEQDADDLFQLCSLMYNTDHTDHLFLSS